jgi:hypothetical protein
VVHASSFCLHSHRNHITVNWHEDEVVVGGYETLFLSIRELSQRSTRGLGSSIILVGSVDASDVTSSTVATEGLSVGSLE